MVTRIKADISTKNHYAFPIREGATKKEAMAGVHHFSRDSARTPMQWNTDANAGFTKGRPWLPVYNDYKKGIINKDDFIDCCYSASIEQAIVSAGALLGAPIPVIGPIIGATIARYTYKFVASAVNEYDIACSNLAKERSHIVDLKVEHEFSEYKKKITNNYARYDKLLEKTAHPSINLARTFRLCEERGINPERDLHVFIERFPIKK